MKPSAKDAFGAAVAWFRRRIPLGDKEYAKLKGEAQQAAFHVAGVEQAQTVAGIWRSLANALETGKPYGEWRKETVAVISENIEATRSATEARTETIFRNALQTATSAGRHEVLVQPEVLSSRPVWQFVSVGGDGRTSDICSALNGAVVSASSPWWQTHWPPCHHNCRSTVRTFSLAEARRRGLAPKEQGPDIRPQSGFGRPPSLQTLEHKTPELPAELARLHRNKTRA